MAAMLYCTEVKSQRGADLYHLYSAGSLLGTPDLAHGIIKEREVPAKDIERALKRERLFEQDPDGHTYREG